MRPGAGASEELLGPSGAAFPKRGVLYVLAHYFVTNFTHVFLIKTHLCLRLSPLFLCYTILLSHLHQKQACVWSRVNPRVSFCSAAIYQPGVFCAALANFHKVWTLAVRLSPANSISPAQRSAPLSAQISAGAWKAKREKQRRRAASSLSMKTRTRFFATCQRMRVWVSSSLSPHLRGELCCLQTHSTHTRISLFARDARGGGDGHKRRARGNIGSANIERCIRPVLWQYWIYFARR